jgi:Tol biopolymer transport system component
MGAPLPPGGGGVHPADALRAEADALEAASCHADGSSCAFDEFARLAGAVGGNTAVPPRIEIPDVTLHEGDRGRNHTAVAVRLSHPATEYVSASVTGDLPEGVTIAPDSTIWFAARTLRSIAGFEVANDDTEGPTRTTELGATVTAGLAQPPDPFTVTVIDDDEDGTPAKRPGANGRLAFTTGSDAQLYIAEPGGTDVEGVLDSTNTDQLQPEGWSSDGRFLLMHRWTTSGSDDAAGGRPYYALPVGEDARPTGDKIRLTPAGTGLYEGASWSRDGKWLSYITYRGSTWTLSLQRVGVNGAPVGEMIDVTDDPDMANIAWVDGTSWSPDGKRLAMAACEQGYDVCGIYVLDVHDGSVTGAPRPVIRRDYLHGEDADLPSWSPDGRFLAYRVRDSSYVETVERVAVDTAGAPKGPAVTLTTQRIELPVRWSPDSRSVVFASSEHPLTDQFRSGVVVGLDSAGRPSGAPKVVTPLAFGPNVIMWGPPVLDKVAPTASATLDKPANGQGWHRDTVIAKLRAEDDEGGDGVASVTYTVDGKKTTATGAAKDVPLSADGVHTLAYFATDKAGNASAARSLVVRVDRTPPAVAFGSPAAGAAHVVGTSVTAAYSCSDGGSGVVGCDGSTPAGGPLDTGAPGARTLAVTARDRAGNTATVDRAWSVVARPQPVVVVTPKLGKAPPAATLPSTRRCVSRRRFRIRLARPSGDPLRSAEVFIGSKRVRRIRGRKLTTPIDLRGLPKGKFKVRVVVKTRSGRKLSITRTYRTCVPKRRRH